MRTIKEIIDDAPVDKPVKAFKGIITDVYEQATGTKKDTGKEWKRQNITIKDSTGFITVKLWGSDELDETDIGKTIECRGKQDAEGDWIFCPKLIRDDRTKKKLLSYSNMWRSKSVTGETDKALVEEFHKRKAERAAKKAARASGGNGAATLAVPKMAFEAGTEHFLNCYRTLKRECSELGDLAIVKATGTLFERTEPAIKPVDFKKLGEQMAANREAAGVHEETVPLEREEAPADPPADEPF